MTKQEWLDAQIELLSRNPGNITSVKRGMKTVNGRETATDAAVVCVKKKAAKLADVPVRARIPQETAFGLVTDVIECGYEIRTPPAKVDVEPFALTQTRRPCPAGYSIGHVNITAGTLGMWAKRAGHGSLWFFISNNHVLANINEGVEGDSILQAGRVDGGRAFGKLSGFVKINIPGGDPDEKKPFSRALWRTYMGIGNRVARATRSRSVQRIFRVSACNYRVNVRPQSINQPTNQLDTAFGLPLDQSDVMPEIENVGVVEGVRDAVPGDLVRCNSRTTGMTRGRCTDNAIGINVNMGQGRIVPFVNQAEFVSLDDNKPFSEGGDSGGSIVDGSDPINQARLFAGGGGNTYGNHASVEASYLGLVF